METLVHVHNDVLVKIPIWIKLLGSEPPHVIDGVFPRRFSTPDE
jgi:hypothetical protein